VRRGAVFTSKYTRKYYSAGLCADLLGSLQLSRDPLKWLKGRVVESKIRRGREGEKDERKERRFVTHLINSVCATDAFLGLYLLVSHPG